MAMYTPPGWLFVEKVGPDMDWVGFRSGVVPCSLQIKSDMEWLLRSWAPADPVLLQLAKLHAGAVAQQPLRGGLSTESSPANLEEQKQKEEKEEEERKTAEKKSKDEEERRKEEADQAEKEKKAKEDEDRRIEEAKNEEAKKKAKEEKEEEDRKKALKAAGFSMRSVVQGHCAGSLKKHVAALPVSMTSQLRATHDVFNFQPIFNLTCKFQCLLSPRLKEEGR